MTEQPTDRPLPGLSTACRTGAHGRCIHDTCGCACHSAQRPIRSIEELIEASSLGTPEAKAARESVDTALAAEIVRRSQQIDPNDPLMDSLIEAQTEVETLLNWLADCNAALDESRAQVDRVRAEVAEAQEFGLDYVLTRTLAAALDGTTVTHAGEP